MRLCASVERMRNEWVMRTLSKRLEEDTEPPYRLCIHHRDLVVGLDIIANIVNTMEYSAHCIIILSTKPRYNPTGGASSSLIHSGREVYVINGTTSFPYSSQESPGGNSLSGYVEAYVHVTHVARG